jgi:hypothetical protein
MNMEQSWNDNDRGKPTASIETCPSATLHNIHSTRDRTLDHSVHCLTHCTTNCRAIYHSSLHRNAQLCLQQLHPPTHNSPFPDSLNTHCSPNSITHQTQLQFRLLCHNSLSFNDPSLSLCATLQWRGAVSRSRKPEHNNVLGPWTEIKHVTS